MSDTENNLTALQVNEILERHPGNQQGEPECSACHVLESKMADAGVSDRCRMAKGCKAEPYAVVAFYREERLTMSTVCRYHLAMLYAYRDGDLTPPHKCKGEKYG